MKLVTVLRQSWDSKLCGSVGIVIGFKRRDPRFKSHTRLVRE